MGTLLLSCGLLCQTALAEEQENKTEQTTEVSSEAKEESAETKQEPATNPLLKITETTQHGMGDLSKYKNIETDPNSKTRANGTPYISVNTKGVPRWDFIDVSSNNGSISVSQYKTMKKYGVKGVCVKLTEATSYRNPLAKSQIENAKKAGLYVTTYHFSHFANKSQAIAEANYYANYAKQLNLPKTPLMVNDFECNCSGEFNNGTANSLAFASRLKALGYRNVYTYASGSMFGTRLSATKLGKRNLWVAGYPYSPSSKNLQYTGNAAWQWTDNMHFPGHSSVFDANIDYTGFFTNGGKEAKPTFHKNNKYMTVMKNNYNVYKGLAPYKKSGTTKGMYHRTYIAKGYYDYRGERYYTLYNASGDWKGYVNEKGLKSSNESRGAFIPTKGYGSVNKKNYDAWNDIVNFSSKRHKSSTVYQKTYKIKGFYRDVNGRVYLSCYNDDNEWQGYINDDGVDRLNVRRGLQYKSSSYATTMKNNYTIWRDLEKFDRKNGTTSSCINRTYRAKYKYNHVNGHTYYSLYNADNDWIGYVDAKGLDVTKSAAGHAFGTDRDINRVRSNYSVWKNIANFNDKYGVAGDFELEDLPVTAYYNHFNRHKYYQVMLTNSDKAYIDAKGVTLK